MMTMSNYYINLRNKIGPDLIFMPSVAAVIRNEKDEILFGRKYHETHWGLIAGAIEIGETPAQAVRREVLEETGLIVNPVRIIGVFGGEKYRYVYANGHKVEYLTIVFDCKVIGGELHSKNEEMEELKFFKESDIPSILIPYPKNIFYKENLHLTHFEDF